MDATYMMRLPRQGSPQGRRKRLRRLSDENHVVNQEGFLDAIHDSPEEAALAMAESAALK